MPKPSAERLDSVVLAFLRERLDPQRPVVLGLSGGPDSLALLYALVECRGTLGVDLHVAHIDHRWRAESRGEASQLEQLCRQLNIPFHLHVLEQGKPPRHAEEIGRRERLRFFSAVSESIGSQAVLLAHQSEDLAENVLKKIFEGGALMQGSGLRPVTELDGLVIWRPLLKVSKAEIVAYLERRGLVAFDDVTNSDPSYLRGRMRQTLLPLLSDVFGKEVVPGLCSVGEEADALREYLDDKVAHFLKNILEVPWGLLLDLGGGWPESPVELKHLVRALCARAGFVLSKDSLTAACQLIRGGEANHKVAMGTSVLHIDRRRLLACRREVPVLGAEAMPLRVGRNVLGAWVIDVIEAADGIERLGWREVVGGEAVMLLPRGDYCAGYGEPQARVHGRQLGRLWSDHKVPTFLRACVPVISDRSGVCGEFLSGVTGSAAADGACWKVTLKSL